MHKYKNDIPPCNLQCYLRKLTLGFELRILLMQGRGGVNITDITVCTPIEHSKIIKIHKYKKLQHARSCIIQNYTAM
jgi:hypothetical protein